MPDVASRSGGNGVIVEAAPGSPAAEAYRVLRTNIQFSSLDNPAKTLMVVAATRGDAATVAANLAVSMAEAGRRVIAVDCDLRHPSFSQIFGLDGSRGVTTMLLDEAGEAPLQATGVPNLQVLTSGPLPPNPADILASERMARVVTRLGEMADVAIFVTPPVAVVADAAALAARVDGVLLVVESGKTRREAARRATEQLRRVGARLLGVVLINV